MNEQELDEGSDPTLPGHLLQNDKQVAGDKQLVYEPEAQHFEVKIDLVELDTCKQDVCK